MLGEVFMRPAVIEPKQFVISPPLLTVGEVRPMDVFRELENPHLRFGQRVFIDDDLKFLKAHE